MSWSSLDTYTHGLAFFTTTIAEVTSDSWERPSPCEGWTALDVVGHVGEATRMGARILRGGDLTFSARQPPSSAVTGEPSQWWQEAASEARDALDSVVDLDREVDSPMGRRTIREGLSFPAVDLFLHSWDLATATGTTVTLPDEAITFTRAMFDNIPEEIARRPGVFGPAVSATEGASPTEALMAWTGRNPHWTPAT